MLLTLEWNGSVRRSWLINSSKKRKDFVLRQDWGAVTLFEKGTDALWKKAKMTGLAIKNNILTGKHTLQYMLYTAE